MPFGPAAFLVFLRFSGSVTALQTPFQKVLHFFQHSVLYFIHFPLSVAFLCTSSTLPFILQTHFILPSLPQMHGILTLSYCFFCSFLPFVTNLSKLTICSVSVEQHFSYLPFFCRRHSYLSFFFLSQLRFFLLWIFSPFLVKESFFSY